MSHLMRESDDPLYKKPLLRLAADATGAGRLAAPDASALCANPICGDRVRMDVTLAEGRITALAHETQGCLLTQASAAILGRIAPGMAMADLATLEDAVRAMLKDGAPPPEPDYAAFAGAADLPARHICVLLPLQALRATVEDGQP
jgi:nitrogen fixation NifU-like protein